MTGRSNSVRAIGHYTPDQAARLVGVSARRLGAWARLGVVRPSVSTEPRVYSYADVGEAVLAHQLHQDGARPRDIKAIVDRLRGIYGEWPLSTAPLERDGALVVVREGNELHFEAYTGEQRVMTGTLVNLERVKAALAHGGWVAVDVERPLIQVDPNRHSGAPVIRGRRIPTATVAAIAEEGDLEELREGYGLSDAEIRAAIDYERAVGKALAA